MWRRPIADGCLASPLAPCSRRALLLDRRAVSDEPRDPDLTDLRRQIGDATRRDRALRVAVVTAYHREPPEQLAQCHESVRAQTHTCTHIVVADGHPSPIVDAWGAQHIVLPRAHDNYGATPRAVGSLSAIAQGFDAIAYLDADNWYEPDHLATMAALHQKSGAAVCVAARTLRRIDGSLLDASGEPGDGVSHVDTSCLFLTATAFHLAPLWGLVPPALRAIDDRIMWSAIRGSGVRVARWHAPTVSYRTTFRVHYEERGEAAPPGAKTRDHVTRALDLWSALAPYERALLLQRLGVRT
jgi:glycosyltransferase involved in cell wall biosynthesis